MICSLAAAACTLLACVQGAAAQSVPGGDFQARNPVCTRLEGQLAAIERGGGDPRAEQIKRYEDAAARQQAELDRMTEQARRMGCEGGGFFLFGRGQSQQCDQINAQIQRMRGNLDRILSGLRQLQGAGPDREEQRRAILISLAQYDCGPQYRSTQRSRGIFETLFGGGPYGGPGGAPDYPTDPQQSSTFKTVCVRTCDGFFFPINNAATQGRFAADERICQRACPASEAALYAFRNPGETIAQAVSINGRPYTELPNAFKFRQEYNPSCTCKQAGQSWAEAVPDDPTVERGDVIVTEERAKQLSAPKTETKPPQRQPQQQRQQTRGRAPARAGAAPQAGAAPAPAQAAVDANPPAPAPAGDPGARTVGRQYYR
ncbi:MAG: DUF2865 domain-containing protein [Variibacter sp.]|nr:DUF2865 domain-containing protein [Variibacter sp.]